MKFRKKGFAKNSLRLIFTLFLLGFLFLLQACTMASPEVGPVSPSPEEEPAAEVEPTTYATKDPLYSMQTASSAPTRTTAQTPAGVQTQVSPLAPTEFPSIPEQRRLTLEFPPTIRAGDSDTIRLTLEIDNQGNLVPTAVIDGNEVTGEIVEIPNLYETHHVIAEAKIDMAGIEIQPAGMISSPLLPGEEVTFLWSVLPEDAGRYRGTVWLYLRFLPKDGSAELQPRTISAQPIEINATTYLGFKAGPARTVGAIGTFLGAVLGFPFADDVIKWLWKKIKKKSGDGK